MKKTLNHKPATTSTSNFTTVIFSQSNKFISKLSPTLENAGYVVLSANSISDLSSIVHAEVSTIIVDGANENPDTMLQSPLLKSSFPNIQIIVLGEESHIKKKSSEHPRIWRTPNAQDQEAFLILLAKACILWEINKTNTTLRAQLGSPQTPVQIIGSSPQTRETINQVQKVCNLDASILLTGESGTGKSTLARFIHQQSNRRNKPFVMISCASIPRDLLESELFGHERGAFTGAVSARAGSIEVANGGTLFLDEIGDLPLELQPKLLTFIQDRVVKRIGSTSENKVDVRVIAATNRDLADLVKRKEFRSDLYYRINVISIEVPALRDRISDLPLLINHIAERIAFKQGKEPPTLSGSALTKAFNHTWPGNIRELENVIERAVAFSEGPVIESKDLKLGEVAESRKGAAHTEFPLVGLSLKEIERRAIEETLRHCAGNKTHAAKMLGISLKSIYNKLSE